MRPRGGVRNAGNQAEERLAHCDAFVLHQHGLLMHVQVEEAMWMHMHLGSRLSAQPCLRSLLIYQNKRLKRPS